MAQGSVQIWPPVTVNRIVQTAIFRLAMHPLLVDPPITDVNGKPLRINKFRNYDGRELKNPNGITLSVYPYHYAQGDATTSLTVNSENAGVVFDEKQTTLGGDKSDLTAYIKARANIQLKLHMFGYSNQSESDNTISEEQNTLFEHNYIEWAVRQYAEVVAAVLRDDLHHLPAFPNGNKMRLLANSFVHHIDYPTATQDKSSNLILHSATITWHTDYYVPIRWRRQPRYLPVEMSDGNLQVGYITDAQNATIDVFYDTMRNVFLRADGTTIDRSDLTDPATSHPYSTLDPDLMALIDSAPKGLLDLSFYFKREDDSPC
jgi:hypothetical protein